MLKLAVFVSGRGSNLKSIVDSIETGKLNAIVLAVISNKSDAPALSFAKDKSILTFVVSSNNNQEAISFFDLSQKMIELEIDLIVLAGFLKKIPDDFVELFFNKMINIHPALLPSFGGKGMYGMNVHQAVFKSSAKVSGATVHFVNQNYDEGKIIAQKCVDISDVNAPEEIAERVLSIEHQLLPEVIQLFAEGKVKIINQRVVIG
ncbi:phosphoribosylglycinamide formyltransferase [hydrocarbon metagenome]|uniref:phosphoribosylglycinamide formyltransferase 1 n=1 Tax=hydrocarbon metagenome TaxID=938273 RepID=A0A0W8G0W8_9ZZZZ